MDIGMGRTAFMKDPLTLKEVINRTKEHIKCSNLRLGLSIYHTMDSKIGSIAVCAGSGGEILRKTKADVILTGEMSHHDVLDAVHRGSTVILTEHSNSERGFLHVWIKSLSKNFDPIKVIVSETDADPLKVI